MRARLVACEVNKGQKNAEFYASTPPLESKKLLFSQFASEKRRLDSMGKMQHLRLSFIDIKKKPISTLSLTELSLCDYLLNLACRRTTSRDRPSAFMALATQACSGRRHTG